jgi:hypothetical protein
MIAVADEYIGEFVLPFRQGKHEYLELAAIVVDNPVNHIVRYGLTVKVAGDIADPDALPRPALASYRFWQVGA